MSASIVAMHAVLPPHQRTASEVDLAIGESEGWTKRKTGVETRHVAAHDSSVADMGAEVVREVVENSSFEFADIDAIVFASATREQFLPCTASIVANRIGDDVRGIPAFDIDASCLSWVLALDLMSRAMTTGMYRRIVVASAELATRAIDPADKEGTALFGDGAVAAILEVDTQIEPFVRHIGRSRFETYAEGAHHTQVRVGTTYDPNRPGYQFDADDFRFLMNGPKVYELAAREYPGFIERFLADVNLSLSDFDFIVPHQASKPAVELLARRLKVPKGTYAQDYRRFGNTVSASIPLSLCMARQEGRVRPGDRVLLTGTAAGLSMGALVVEI